MGEALILFIPFVFGAAVGSFLNVCIYRLPLGLSVVSPPSHCPSCGAKVAFYDNIPILSFMVLMGRCRRCSAPFSARYLFVEALTGLLAVALLLRFSLTPEFFVSFVFVAALIVVTFIDLDHRIIPDVISLPGIVVGFVAAFFLTEPGVFNSLLGILAGGGVLFAIAYGYYLATGGEGMGGGDIKLLAMIGAFVGWKGVLFTILVGSFLGALIGGGLMLIYGKDSKYAIPFGPFLAAGAAAFVFFGPEAIGWYLSRLAGQ